MRNIMKLVKNFNVYSFRSESCIQISCCLRESVCIYFTPYKIRNIELLSETRLKTEIEVGILKKVNVLWNSFKYVRILQDIIIVNVEPFRTYLCHMCTFLFQVPLSCCDTDLTSMHTALCGNHIPSASSYFFQNKPTIYRICYPNEQ